MKLCVQELHPLNIDAVCVLYCNLAQPSPAFAFVSRPNFAVPLKHLDCAVKIAKLVLQVQSFGQTMQAVWHCSS